MVQGEVIRIPSSDRENFKRFCEDMNRLIYQNFRIDRHSKAVLLCSKNDYQILFSAAALPLPAVLRLSLSLIALAFQNKLGLSPSAT